VAATVEECRNRGVARLRHEPGTADV